MATTFKINNGDIVFSNITGRPNMVGNILVENTVQSEAAQAREKIRQDLRGGLSLERVRAGTTASIQSIIGTVPQFGASAVALLVNRQIRDMISAMIKEQSRRPSIRPPSEKIRSISRLQVFPNKNTNDPTAFKFRLGIRSQDNEAFDLTGSIG